jgi:hypothetical protein
VPASDASSRGALLGKVTNFILFHHPRAPDLHPDHIRVGVPRSEAVRQAKQDLEIFSLLAVPLSAQARLGLVVFS